MNFNNDKFTFIQRGMSEGITNLLNGQFESILFQNIIYYIPRQSVNLLLAKVTELTKDGAHISLHTRSIKDYRYGRGVEWSSAMVFILEVEGTGEYGSLNVFYYEYELIDMLRSNLGLKESSIQIFTVDSINSQKGVPVYNSDIVIWGRC